MDSAAKEDQNGDGSTVWKKTVLCWILPYKTLEVPLKIEEHGGLVKELPLRATASPGH